MSSILFEHSFVVDAINPDGRQYDFVDRIRASATSAPASDNLSLVFDTNHALWPLSHGQSFTLVLASSLDRASAAATNSSSKTSSNANGADGTEKKTGSWRPNAEKDSLADEFEYVLQGKVYNFDQAVDQAVTAYISFGGLLLVITGAYRHLAKLRAEDDLYCLCRR